MEFTCCAKKIEDVRDVSQVYTFLRVIADPNRLKILCILQGGAKCVCEIVLAIRISDKLASHHLKQLKKIGLLIEKRKGNYIYYSLNRKKIKEYKSLFNKIVK